MPPKGKNNNKNPTRKRRPRRRQGGSKQPMSSSAPNNNMLSQIVEPWMPLFPPKTRKQLRYASGHIGLSSTSGVVVTQVFSLNGMYDPDVTGTGHQPMGFDQMMAFYEHYTVIRTRCECRFASATGTFGVACARVDAAATPITNIEQIMEFGGNVTAGLEAVGSLGANKVLNFNVDIAKFQGVPKKALLADTTLRGDVANNPSEQSYLHCQLFNPAGVTCTANLYVIMEFDAIFTEPRTAVESLHARDERKTPSEAKVIEPSPYRGFFRI